MLRPLVLALLVSAPAFAEPPLEILTAYRAEVATKADWAHKRIDAPALRKEVEAGTCANVPGRAQACASKATQDALLKLLDAYESEKHALAYAAKQEMVPRDLEKALVARLGKLDKKIATVRAGKTDGVYCDKARTKLDLVDGCYLLAP